MKKLILIVALLFVCLLQAQKPKVEYQRWKKVTTVEKLAIDVSDTTVVYEVYDTDLERKEIYDSEVGSWQPYSGSGTDENAIHDNEAGEINALTEKVTPVSGDQLIIEDSENGYVKRRVAVGNLPFLTSADIEGYQLYSGTVLGGDLSLKIGGKNSIQFNEPGNLTRIGANNNLHEITINGDPSEGGTLNKRFIEFKSPGFYKFKPSSYGLRFEHSNEFDFVIAFNNSNLTDNRTAYFPNGSGTFALQEWVTAQGYGLLSGTQTWTAQNTWSYALNYFGNPAGNHLRMYGSTPSMEAHNSTHWAALRPDQLIFNNGTTSVFFKPNPTPEDTNYDVYAPSEPGTIATEEWILDQDFGIGSVSNEAYNESTWNGIDTIAPSKDAIRDKLETMVTLSTPQTLFNKRITPRVGGTASFPSVTPASDGTDIYQLTSLANDCTFNAPSGTPTNGQNLWIRVKDNGTARSLTWHSIYSESSGVDLPSTTIVGETLYIQFIYNSNESQWEAVSVNTSTGATDDQNASEVPVSPAVNGNDNVQDALEDHETRIDNLEVGGMAQSSTITTSRNALLTDADGINIVDSSSEVTITIPAQSSVAWADGTILVYQLDKDATGFINIAYAGGVTGETGRTYSYSRTIKLWRVDEDEWVLVDPPVVDRESFIISASDLTTDITTGDGKAYFMSPFKFWIEDVVVYLDDAGTTTGITVDIVTGDSIFDTLLTTDAGENTSYSATTPYVFASGKQLLLEGNKVVINFDAVPTGATGVQVIISGFRW